MHFRQRGQRRLKYRYPKRGRKGGGGVELQPLDAARHDHGEARREVVGRGGSQRRVEEPLEHELEAAERVPR
jgi:hypothetical protein